MGRVGNKVALMTGAMGLGEAMVRLLSMATIGPRSAEPASR